MERVKTVCKDFMYRNCTRENCKFLHDSSVCFYYWKMGECNRGEKCERSHEFRDNRQFKINKIQTTLELKDESNSENISNIKNKNKGKDNDKPHPKQKSKRNKDKYNKNKRKKNTECFEPMTRPVDMRIVCDLGGSNDKCSLQLTSRDVLLAPNVFNNFKTGELYNKLVEEIEMCGIEPEQLLKMWHGNDKIEGTHLIANDRTNWKEKCPTFNFIVNKLCEYFSMNVQATRFNWYKDTSQWKPFHHDAAAVKVDKAKVQNFTVAVSFGETRDAAFEHAETKTVISMPQPDGWIYAFSKDTNVIWRHGILQDNPVKQNGRISIICWGSIDNMLN